LLYFIHPGGLHGEAKKNRSGFALSAARNVGKMYSRSWSMLKRFNPGKEAETKR